MKKRILLSIFCAFASFFTLSGQQFEWARQMSGSGNEMAITVTVDASDNVYTAGYFEGTVDFDPTSAVLNYTATYGDLFVTKYDANGNMLWVKIIGDSCEIIANAIATDQDNNVYITGGLIGTADFDPGPGIVNRSSVNTSETDAFICKLDSNGIFGWVVMMGSAGQDEGSDVIVDSNGDVYATGSFESTIDFDPGPATYNLYGPLWINMYVTKLSGAGNFIWAKSVTGSVGEGLELGGNGNLFVTGFFESTVDFDPNAGVLNLTSNGDRDCFVLKMDTTGNLIWGKAYGGPDDDYPNGIAADATGNIYTTGYFQNTADFNPGPTAFNMTAVLRDAYLLRLDAFGNFAYAKQFSGPDDQTSYAIDLDAAGNIYLTGQFDDVTDFDPGPGTYTITGSNNIFVVRLTPMGNLSWAVELGGGGEGNDLCIDHADNIYTVGAFYGQPADFDPGTNIFPMTAVGGADILLHKMSQGPAGVEENINASGFQLYPNPSTGEIYIVSDKEWEKYSVVNMLGEIVQQGIISFPVSLQNLSPGFYFFQLINSNGEMSQQKFMKL